MTTNFTFRDFLVYLLTGLTLLLSVGLIFRVELFNLSIDFFENYEFIREFTFLLTIFLIPLVYLLGHFVGSINYITLGLFRAIDKKIKGDKKQLSNLDICLIILFQRLFYRHRVIYEVISYTKCNTDKKIFTNENEFWTLCAKLQVEKIFSSAEYWYVLNDLFKSVNLVFTISSLIAFTFGQFGLGIIYFILMLVSYRRARQYSIFFVKTVCRLITAREMSKAEK